jgi:hypothetical protein
MTNFEKFLSLQHKRGICNSDLNKTHRVSMMPEFIRFCYNIEFSILDLDRMIYNTVCQQNSYPNKADLERFYEWFNNLSDQELRSIIALMKLEL